MPSTFAEYNARTAREFVRPISNYVFRKNTETQPQQFENRHQPQIAFGFVFHERTHENS